MNSEDEEEIEVLFCENCKKDVVTINNFNECIYCEINNEPEIMYWEDLSLFEVLSLPYKSFYLIK